MRSRLLPPVALFRDFIALLYYTTVRCESQAENNAKAEESLVMDSVECKSGTISI